MSAKTLVDHFARIYRGQFVLIDLIVDGSKVVRIERLQTFPVELRRKGHARKVMNRLCALADEHQCHLSFAVRSYSSLGMQPEDLAAWLARLGFEGCGEMVRRPGGG